MSIPPGYSTVYPSVKQFTEKDIQTIKEVIKYYRMNIYNSQNAVIAEKTRAALEKKMNVNSRQQTLPFLQTILMDYTYFNS